MTSVQYLRSESEGQAAEGGAEGRADRQAEGRAERQALSGGEAPLSGGEAPLTGGEAPRSPTPPAVRLECRLE